MMLFFIAAAIFAPRFIKDIQKRQRDRNGDIVDVTVSLKLVRVGVRGACAILAVIFMLMTSCLIIDDDKVGHLARIYMGSKMPQGRIIAAPNQKGPQAEILPPGFHFIPFITVTHRVEELDIVHVEEGHYGYLVAKDGNPMPDGQFIADAWNDAGDMIDAMKFMGYEEGMEKPLGTKGPQLTVLPPGDYRINRYLFDIYAESSTAVPVGYVAVIKSNVGDDYHGDPILPSGIDASDLSVPIVPKGYRGVWADVYTPGEYYINKKAYHVTLVDTRVQTWKYLGGYTRKWIDLVIEDDGKIHQNAHEEEFKMPADAADTAIVLRVEGWDVYQDARVQVQVTPENAPFVVASVGGIDNIEEKIITPNFRSILRNVVSKEVTVTEQVEDEFGNLIYLPALDQEGKVIEGAKGEPKMHTVTRPRRVLDLLYHRAELEKAVAKELIPAGAQAGLTVQWVRFGDPAVPPSLLIPGKRKQLATSLIATYQQEQRAQQERVQSEKEKARADQQASLMESEIGIKVAENNAEARTKEGLGEKAFLENIAKGQKAQALVLGEEYAYQLAALKEVLSAAKEKPEIIKYPEILVQGGNGSSLEGAAAILGRSNLNMGGLIESKK